MTRQLKWQRLISLSLAFLMIISLFLGAIPALVPTAQAAANAIENDSLSVQIGDLGQISVMNIKNNTRDINFVLPNTTSQQNNTAHQWMGEMIFATRSAATREGLTGSFTEQDVNRTLAAGGSTTASNISASNPYITKTANGSSSVEVNYIGQDLSSTTARTMKGYDVKSVYNMDTDDGSLLWTITLSNKSSQYIEFGDIGLPMPWNNKYASTSDTYSNRLTVHSFAGADSGYGYAIRCSGEGNYMLFTPVVETGARVEYVDHWVGTGNGTSEYRSGSLYTNWLADSGGWFPGLSVFYIHSKNIRTQTGRGYFTDDSSLILAPGEEKSYSFKFSAVRAGDGQPGQSASSEQNASASNEEREKNFRSILYKEGMIDAVAVPSFQTAINMDTLIDLHYDENLIDDVRVNILCVHENDPYDREHIPTQRSGMVNNSRTGRGAHDGNPEYTEAVEYVETKIVDGEQHHIYRLKFGCIGNNSVRVDYKLKSTGDAKFTEFEFNVLAELDRIADVHADFMANTTQDIDPNSATFGIYSDWYFASGKDGSQRSHWGDDWSHDNVNFMAMKNYLAPDPDQVKSLETYLVDFMWNNYMKNTQDNFIVANYLSASGIYGTSSNPYTRTFSEVMEATAFFNMYRIVKAYPDLIEYREPAAFYLQIAYGIYHNRAGSGTTGFYGEQQIPDMIEALYAEGMTAEGDALKQQFAYSKGRAVANTTYPYGSEFEYDNTGEEGAYSAANALIKYYPENDRVSRAYNAMAMANRKTRAMRGIQPTWYHYADPVFRGGEGWWNFQYTASLAGYIMDDYLRYQDDSGDSAQWSERLSYAAKLSNFNAVNMGQISSSHVGNVSWRFTMYKGGSGAQNVNDGGTRVMNNGWNDFSGESDEGLYGSLLSISADVTTDPVFGLFGYGANVSLDDGVYSVEPTDGFGKRINLIDERIYVSSEQDAIQKAEIAADGSTLKLTLRDKSASTHVSKITIDGDGVRDGFYGIYLNGEKTGQVFISDNSGVANVAIAKDLEGAVIEIKALEDGENEAPAVEIYTDVEKPAALVPFTLRSVVTDDGAPAGSVITYAWSVESAPEGGELTFGTPDKDTTTARATVEGAYVVAMTASDGDKSTKVTYELTVLSAPERTAPVINSAEGTSNYYNPTIADLTVDATADIYYQGELSYHWELISAPAGQTATIAYADTRDASLLVSGPGAYVVKVTVTDADKSSEREITVTMGADADGIQRGAAITTRVKNAPVLPETLSVILPDGTIANKAVTWDPVAPASYAVIGVFDATGTAEGNIAVAVPVYVITGNRVNIAPLASPTAIINTPSDLGGVAGLNDEYEPASSSDTAHGVWHNWRGDQGDTAWVQYTWDEAMVIDGQDAYYFRDGGGNFQPKNIVVEYLDSKGEWREVPNAKGLGNALNQYNTTSWGAVRTTALRMMMDPVTLGCGVIEWKVYGYSSDLNTKALNAAISQAQAMLPLLSGSVKAEIEAEIQAALELMSNEDATQEQIDAETTALLELLARAFESITGALGEDVAPNAATVYSDYTASWENLDGINNTSFEPTSSSMGTRLGWGNWSQTTGSEHYVGYTWAEPVTVGAMDIYWYDDGGGTRVPSAYKMQYMDTNGVWQNVTIVTPYEETTALNTYNRINIYPITCTDLRLIMTTASNASGIYRFKVYESLPSGVDFSLLEQAVATAQALDSEDYTEVSFAPIAGALTAAEAVLANEDATQKEIDDAAAALNAAIESLVTKPEAVAAMIKALDSPITEESTAAVEAARAAYDALTDAQKGQVRNYVSLLKAEAQLAKLAAEKAKADAEAAAASALADAKYAAAAATRTYATRLQDLDNPDEEALAEVRDQALLDIDAAETVEDAEEVLTNAISDMDELKSDAGLRVLVFDDVQDEESYFFAPVYRAVDHTPQITNGTDATHFSPDKACTRAQVVTFLWRAAGAPAPSSEDNPFADVAEGAYYYDAVLWAAEEGITNGTGAAAFSPDSTCTRGQVVAFLYRFGNKPAVSAGENPFRDLRENAFYSSAVAWAVKEGITKGISETEFGPEKTCTRAQIVTFLDRALDGK